MIELSPELMVAMLIVAVVVGVACFLLGIMTGHGMRDQENSRLLLDERNARVKAEARTEKLLRDAKALSLQVYELELRNTRLGKSNQQLVLRCVISGVPATPLSLFANNHERATP